MLLLFWNGSGTDTVDIVYTEVMAFTLAIATSAEFDVIMPMIIDFELYEELSA